MATTTRRPTTAAEAEGTGVATASWRTIETRGSRARNPAAVGSPS